MSSTRISGTADAPQLSSHSGAFRAAVFGINDGLVSNLSLIMGIVGAHADAKLILLTGIAGMLAGAFSMGAGEYISVSAQRELFEHQIATERRELTEDPESEQQELELLYRRKGMPREAATVVASTMMADLEVALDTHSREELGLNPHELGSPIAAALSSFAAFIIGALIPVIPYALLSAQRAFLVSMLLSVGALFCVGILIATFTGRGWVYGGTRMLCIGSLAAAVTYGTGYFIGVTTGL